VAQSQFPLERLLCRSRFGQCGRHGWSFCNHG
jgi:hypothetical protein